MQEVLDETTRIMTEIGPISQKLPGQTGLGVCKGQGGKARSSHLFRSAARETLDDGSRCRDSRDMLAFICNSRVGSATTRSQTELLYCWRLEKSQAKFKEVRMRFGSRCTEIHWVYGVWGGVEFPFIHNGKHKIMGRLSLGFKAGRNGHAATIAEATRPLYSGSG